MALKCEQGLLRAIRVAALTGAILVLAFAAWVIIQGHTCFLDVLNAMVMQGADFKPFYGGVPGLPPPADLVPGIETLEALYPRIREEALAVAANWEAVPAMRDLYNHNFASGKEASSLTRALSRLVYGRHANIFNKIHSPHWRTFNLVVFDQEVPMNAYRCPATMAALRGVKGLQSALFSFMGPGAYVPPHSDPGKGVIRYHLGLRVPETREKCFIQVEPDPGLDPTFKESLRYHWGEGESVLFDDVFPHWVRNDSEEVRVILFVDIKRPLKTLLAKSLQGMADLANHHHPGVRNLLQASAVPPTLH